MKLIMPFWDLEILPRYLPQFSALAENVGTLTILYLYGDPIPRKNMEYHKVELPQGINRQHGMYRLMDTIPEQVMDLDFDAVYSLSGRWLQQAAASISRATEKPLVLRIRGDETIVARIRQRDRIFDIFFHDPFQGSFEQASLVIPIAQKLVATAYRLGAENVSNPIPNGINHIKFKPSPMPDSLTVGYVGRLSVEKGSEFLHSLVHATPNVHYLIAGKVHGNFNPPPNCDLLGPIPYSQIQEVYAACSVILIPSLTEGYPNTLLEAYACGRPIMITPEAHPQEAHLYGWKMPHGDGWQRVLNHLQRKSLESLGKEAHEYSKGFTWKRYGERMAAAINTILDDQTISLHQLSQEAPQPP